MGTMYFTDNRSKNAVIQELLRVDETEKFKFVNTDHSVRGNELWILSEVTNKETGVSVNRIHLYLLSRCQGNWGYKGISEAEHPYYYNCPKKFLKAAPVQNQVWRDGVIARAKSKSRKFETGEIYFLKGVAQSWMEDHGDRVRLTSVSPLRGISSKSHMPIRIKRNQIGDRVSG